VCVNVSGHLYRSPDESDASVAECVGGLSAVVRIEHNGWLATGLFADALLRSHRLGCEESQPSRRLVREADVQETRPV